MQPLRAPVKDGDYSPEFNSGSAPICSEPFLTFTTVHVIKVARTLGSDNQGRPTDSSLHKLLHAVSSPLPDHLACVKENVDDRNAEGNCPSFRVPVAQGSPSATRRPRFDSDFLKFIFVSKYIYIYIHIYIFIFIYLFICVCIYIYMNVCICVYIYIYIYIYFTNL